MADYYSVGRKVYISDIFEQGVITDCIIGDEVVYVVEIESGKFASAHHDNVEIIH